MDTMTLADLKKLPQWVAYTADKVPIDPHTGRAAKSNAPGTWGTAGQAWSRKKRDGLPGIGYVFTRAAGVVGVDLDDCFAEDGTLSDEAMQIVNCLNSYTERSPSGRGLHILVCGEIPHSVKTPTVEIYDELRYFTVTGNEYSARSPIEHRQDQLSALFVVYGGDIEPTRLPDIAPARHNDITEAEVREMLGALPVWGDYNSFWMPVLMAVHSAFPDERGVALCEAWSPGKPGEVRRKFKSFDNTTRSGITIATLVHMAKEYGYQGSRRTSAPRKMSHQGRMAALAGA